MKVYSVIGVAVFIFLLIGPTPAAAYTIDDSTNGSNTYWGGLVGNLQPSSGDVIGTNFDIAGMNVTRIGATMKVQLIGSYFSHGSARDDGDLYISSTGWHVSNTNGNNPGSKYPSASDTFKTDGTEGWDYVVGVKQTSVVIDGRRSIVPVPGVYKLIFENTDPPFDNAFQFTTGGPSSGGRALQAYKGGYGDFVESATITPDYANSMLTYTFDTSFLADPSNMGFHWAMYCGNDVIEGQVTLVPEPGTFLLLGGGLIALGALRRKFKK